MSQSGVEHYPPLLNNANRGHSRQASKSSVNSNYSTPVINSITNSNHPKELI